MDFKETLERLKNHSEDNMGSGTEEILIQALESDLNIRLPKEYRDFLLEIGYAEIFGDEIYSIYEVPDEIPCKGISWMNKNNEWLSQGYLEFFSNDIDGVFYLKSDSGEVFLNSKENFFSGSFQDFINKLLDD